MRAREFLLEQGNKTPVMKVPDGEWELWDKDMPESKLGMGISFLNRDLYVLETPLFRSLAIAVNPDNPSEILAHNLDRWVFDDKGKPAKENDHFMENAYRFQLTGTKYEDYVINSIPSVGYARGGDAWMGA